MRKTAVRSVAVALIWLGWACAQDGQSKPSEPPPKPEEKVSQTPQSLPPGPLGLQPDLSKPASGDRKEGGDKDVKAATPPPGATEPAKMATPRTSAGDKIAGTVGVDKTYVIGAEDVLTVVVWNQPGLGGSHTVRPDGKISVPLVGDIQASGLTPQQLEKDIAERLKSSDLIRDPHVTVGLTGVHSKKYYINGEVNRPGSFDLVVPTTVMEALVSAGGFKDFANKKHIYILRGAQQFKFNFNQVIAGKHLEQNIMLEPGDIIVIK